MLEGLDWVVLGIYFAPLIGVAWWVVTRENKEDFKNSYSNADIGFSILLVLMVISILVYFS